MSNISFGLLPSVSPLSLPPALYVNSIGIPKPLIGQDPSLVLMVPLTVTPSPTPTATASPEPTPQPTVTVTETAPASTSPSIVLLDGEQFLALTSGIVLVLVFLAALLISQMKRP